MPIKTKLIGKDISFFESHVEENILLLSEALYDQQKTSFISHSKNVYNFKCFEEGKEFSIDIQCSKNKIIRYECSCHHESCCHHIVACLFLLRIELGKKASPKKQKFTKAALQTFLNEIDEAELRTFLLHRLKSDKNLRTLLYARFIIDKKGVDAFESFIDSAFPPSKSATNKPTASELKLFIQVIDEMNDQMIDLVGINNYTDSFALLFPLIKKSFYYKNRLPNPTDRFLKEHKRLVEITKSFAEVIEAPELKMKIQLKTARLLELSYVQFSVFEEKELILNLLNEDRIKGYLNSAFHNFHIDPKEKYHNNFINALHFIVSGEIITTASAIFSEVLSWTYKNAKYQKYLVKIGSEDGLPVKLKEKILETITYSKELRSSLLKIAHFSLQNANSLVAFKWMYSNEKLEWESQRDIVLDNLKKLNKNREVVQILIKESKIDSLFDHLNQCNDMKLSNEFINELLHLSRKETEILYQNWLKLYLSKHFGESANSLVADLLKFLGKHDQSFKKSLEKYIKKNFGKRESLKI